MGELIKCSSIIHTWVGFKPGKGETDTWCCIAAGAQFRSLSYKAIKPRVTDLRFKIFAQRNIVRLHILVK